MTHAAWRVLPSSATPDAARLVSTRALRAFADGLVSVVLPTYLTVLGFSATRIGAITTATLLGSAVLTLGVGWHAHRVGARAALTATAMLMAATGAGFAFVTAFGLLIVISFVGTLNPSGGDVSVFLPLEQSLLPSCVSDRDRTALFARYALGAALVSATGSAWGGGPDFLVRHTSLHPEDAYRLVFGLYISVAVACLLIYRTLTVDSPPAGARRSLSESRRTVFRLAAVFSIDSFGGGFASQAILIVWLHRHFGLSTGATSALFATSSVLSAVSILAAERLARRIGLVRTMVFTHLPADLLYIVAALMPTARLAVVTLLVRAFLSQMDIPARTSYVMAVVTPAERAAAASVTNVPRSLASAIPPVFAGVLLDRTSFGWPLIIAGALKAAYDVLLFVMFRNLRPPEER